MIVAATASRPTSPLALLSGPQRARPAQADTALVASIGAVGSPYGIPQRIIHLGDALAAQHTIKWRTMRPRSNSGGSTVLSRVTLLGFVVAVSFATCAHAALVGSWNFSETGGSIAHDSSGSGINGILGGGASFDPGAGPGGGGAVALAFGGGYVTMGQQFAFSGSTPFSVQAWVELVPGDTRYMLPVGDNLSGMPVGYILELNRPNPGYSTHADAWGSGVITPPSSAVINDGAWHQVVGVYDSTTMSVYVDGVFQNSTGRGTIAPGADFVVGGLDVGGTDQGFYGGLISDVAVWDSALTAGDIASLYQATLTSPVPEPATMAVIAMPLAGLWLVRRKRR